MANRLLRPLMGSPNPGVVIISATVTITDASGTPSLSALTSRGVRSITRNSTGKYTFLFGSSTPAATDNYNYFLGASVAIYNGASAAAAPFYDWPDITPTNGNVAVQFRNTSLTATDPGNGEILVFTFFLSNSSAL